MTPKQEKILSIIERYGRINGITAEDIGVAGGYPRKKAEKWAKPALKFLVKEKKIRRDGERFYKKEDNST